jgi:hypothetical protein
VDAILDARTWPRRDIPDLGFTNEAISVLRGLD